MGAQPIAGRYELLEQLDAGGMGQVWRAYDGVLEREVAVKRIKPDLARSMPEAEELVKRFRREARVTAQIDHHGVPRVYDAVLDDRHDGVYLVMELVRGANLRSFVDPRRPIPVVWAAAVVAQVCAALSHAHALGVVHRDLKPDNVLVTAAGEVKLLDFGIAAILRPDATRLTVTGGQIGTTRYMSPEQVEGGPVSPRSDLYALGCVLHELLSGAPVFDGDNEFRLMRRHVDEPPLALRTLRPDVPEPLETLVLDLLAKEPERRPADVYEVYDRLLPFLPLPGSLPPADAPSPAGMPDPTLVYRRPNAPRSRPEAVPVDAVPGPAELDGRQVAIPAAEVAAGIKAAWSEADRLLERNDFARAAGVLHQALQTFGDVLGVESPRVLGLRLRLANVFVLQEDFRQALAEFDDLAAAYARASGPASRDVLNCRRQAAHCRAQLGQVSVALREFQAVLGPVRDADGDASDTALDLRRGIGILLAAEGRTTEAVEHLRQLYDDLVVVRGAGHEETREVADVLAGLPDAGEA